MYAHVLRPLLFLLPPAAAHGFVMWALGAVEHAAPIRALLRHMVVPPADDRLVTHVMGLTFPSPIGLAAGFDKNALRPRALAALGFGHIELGTVTAQPQGANPKPNLFRCPADHVLINRLGFPNDGAARVAERVRRARRAVGVPVGISIGKSRPVPVSDLDAVIADYLTSFDAARGAADFVVVNVSSPNTSGLRSMQSRDHARALLGALAERADRRTPLLVKIAPDLDDSELESLLEVVEQSKFDGVVATNTTTQRPENLITPKPRVTAIGAGGLSGPPLRARAISVVRRARARLGRDAVIVGVGGVERPQDATAFLRAGANLVQMYTGFVYEGPLAALRMVRGLASTLEREQVRSVSELVSTE
jgi:dihydroorotate dehydrogenase